jgi:hypothetical protein
MSEVLEYTGRGWRVFPCHGILAPGWGIKAPMCDCSLGAGCNEPGKHPACAHGFFDATLDATVISGWRPGSNVAIATGAASGLFVIDIDPRNGGWTTLAALEREHGAFPRDAVVVTGGGGLHLYYPYPRSGEPIGSCGNALGQGIDLKGDGGYVIAPPSRHVSLKSYRWLRGIPSKLPIPSPWLLKIARNGESSRGSTLRDRGNLPCVKTSGHREGQLFAKLLDARDCGSYWKFDCPARSHKTPDAAMYPRENGQVYFVCYSASPCSDNQIRAAVRGMLSEQEIDR